MPKQQARIPASPSIVRQVIPEILQSAGALKRNEITARLRQLLPPRGFSYSTEASIFTTKKALSQLLAEGRIVSRRTGWYELPQNVSGAPEGGGREEVQEESSVGDELHSTEASTPKLKIEREIAEGPECVYVYFHDAYFELAQRKGISVWECKVGWTVGEPDARIIGQGALTCFPRFPVIGLAIRTHDGKNLERLLHAALSYAGVKIKDGAGSEWFLTSPRLVEEWFVQFQESLKLLNSDLKAEPDEKITASVHAAGRHS